MAKTHSNSYICQSCSYTTIKWLGCCPSCKAFNTIELNAVPVSSKKKNTSTLTDLSQVTLAPMRRMLTGIKEWDRVTGGGIVPGSLMILTGDPGIGKSTLLLHIAYALSTNYTVFYFSSEESLEQVKMRTERINCKNSTLLFSDQADLDMLIETCKQQNPAVVIIDSIQNCFLTESDTYAGSVGQLKEAAFKLMRLSKDHGIAILTCGHITKEGVMAGPKTLEHMVDAVFYLQGEERWQTRILRSVKNRFGTISELGFFEMNEQGLVEVPNINEQLLEEISYSPGSLLISFIEGSRPLLIELQALVLPSKYGMPQRVVSGIDQTQVVLIAAILEKYLQIKFSTYDIFFKISGSFKIKSSAADLGIALALLSSYFQKPLPEKSLALAEVSLTGQIKPVNHLSMHSAEAEKFGITHLLLAANQKVETSCKTIKFGHVYELLSLFGAD
ncbi:DNA repair protein RadA [Candidatus Dependentiae bacterium]|nr:DNA repair protein RadA [Candidatus Dependentiae bacterium]